MSTKPSTEAEPLLKKCDRQAALSEVFLAKPGRHAIKSEEEERREAQQKKTARLRTLRLAKEAADREAANEAATKKPSVMRARKTAAMAAVKA